MALSKLGNFVSPESAGIDVGEASARPLAVSVLRDYGLDLSTHTPRDVEQVDLERFGLVVAMNDNIGEYLSGLSGVSSEKLVVWSVKDPAGGDEGDYRQCAAKIADLVSELGEMLSAECGR